MPQGWTKVDSQQAAPTGWTPVATDSPASTVGAAPPAGAQASAVPQGLKGAGSRGLMDVLAGQVQQRATTPLLQVPSDPSMMEQMRDQSIARGDPAKAAVEAFLGGSGRTLSNLISSATSPEALALLGLGAGTGTISKLGQTALTAPFVIQGAKTALTPQQPQESPANALERRSMGGLQAALPVLGEIPAARQIGQDTRTWAGIVKANSDTEEMAHNWLFTGSTDAKQFIKNTQQGIEAHVGQLKNAGEIADRVDAPQKNSVNISDVPPEIERISRKYKGPLEIPLDKFDRAVNTFKLISEKSPYTDLETLLDIRTGLGKLWHSARDPMDAAAVAELRDWATEKARDRWSELPKSTGGVGQLPQFESYNKVWKNMLEYEDQGTLGKLLNTPSGKPFFDALNDPKLGPQLRQLNKDLSEQAGVRPDGSRVFPEDYFKKLAADHKDVYEFTNRKGGVRGVWANATHRPLAALPGAMLGSLVPGHPILGMIAGASGAVSLADRLAAIRNMSRLGGAATIEGKMGPRVEPDFGGGLSGQVIKNLEDLKLGPEIPSTRQRPSEAERDFLENNVGSNVKVSSESFTKKGIVENPANVAKKLKEDKSRSDYAPGSPDRPLNSKVQKAADELSRIRKEKGKPVGEQSREVDRKLGITDKGNEEAQTEQARMLQEFMERGKTQTSRDQLERVIELQRALERRKKPRD